MERTSSSEDEAAAEAATEIETEPLFVIDVEGTELPVSHEDVGMEENVVHYNTENNNDFENNFEIPAPKRKFKEKAPVWSCGGTKLSDGARSDICR